MKKSRTDNLNFKHWFLHGNGHKPGYTRLLDNRSIIDFCIGIVVVILVSTSLKEAAVAVLFPLTGVLVGVCASWAGPAQEVLTSKEMLPFLKEHQGGICEYFLILQTVVFVMLLSIVMWGLAGIGLFEGLNSPKLDGAKFIYYIISSFLYAILSLSIRTCWEAVLYTHYIMHTKIQLLEMEPMILHKRKRTVLSRRSRYKNKQK